MVDADYSKPLTGRVTRLARETGVSSYDAAYLELATRLGVPLATLDSHLRRAAVQQGIARIA